MAQPDSPVKLGSPAVPRGHASGAPVSAAAVFTFVTGAIAQACSARIGPGIAELPSLFESGVADGNARPSFKTFEFKS